MDLAGVTHLGSAGVAALHRLDAEHRASDTTLLLYAPVDSPVDMILTLVGLPHATSDPHTPPDSGATPQATAQTPRGLACGALGDASQLRLQPPPGGSCLESELPCID